MYSYVYNDLPPKVAIYHDTKAASIILYGIPVRRPAALDAVRINK